MKRNAKNFLLDNMLANSTYWVGAGCVAAALMNYFSLPAALVNVIVGLTSTSTIFQVAGANWYARSKNPHRVVVSLSVGWRILLPLAFFTVLLPVGAGAALAPMLYLCAQILFQLSSPAQTQWMVSKLKADLSRDYYSLREAVFMFVLSLSGGAVNLLLNRGQQTDGMRFALLCSAGYMAVFLLASLVPLFRLDPPERTPRRERRMALSAVRDKNFRPILLTGIIWTFAGMFNGSFSATYQVSVLHMSFGTIMIWTLVSNLLRAAATMWMAKLADRFCWKQVCMACMGCMTASGVLWMFIDADSVYPLYPVACALSAVCYAGLSVGLFRFQLAGMPQQSQEMYFSANAVCTGVAACTGSLLCSGLITAFTAAGIPLNRIFLAGAVLGLVSAESIRRVKRQPEDAAAE